MTLKAIKLHDSLKEGVRFSDWNEPCQCVCVCVCVHAFLCMCMYVYVSVYCVCVYVCIIIYVFMGMCDISSPAFHMMYSAYKLNKQDDDIGITS